MKIRTIEYEEWWRCGDGCCDHYDTVTKFFVADKSYEYRGADTYSNLTEFLREIMDIEIEYYAVTKEDYVNAS